MNVQVQRTDYQSVEALRELYRQEANCQIIGDSLLRRGLADAYLILGAGRIAAYGAVRNKYGAGHLTEFYTLPHFRSDASLLFRELLAFSAATHIEAQTNIPLMLTMLFDCTENIVEESILFQDAFRTNLACPNGVFRRAAPDDMITANDEPPGDWVIEADGAIVASGGFLCHYNPPYGDLYMEVTEPARRQGFGGFLLQEVKRVCYEAGKKPAARCNPSNIASRRTLEKAGFLPCGRLLTGEVR